MPLIANVVEVTKRRFPINVKGYTKASRPEDHYYATPYMGALTDTVPKEMRSPLDDKTLPQAYFVEQPPHAIVPPHYHDTNQFQVFIHGETFLGKAKIKPLSLHYAGGHTPYGPITTQEQGVHFFTLRQEWDSGGKPMPEKRDALKPVRRRFRMAENVLDEAILGKRSDVMPCDLDGLGVSLFSLKPNQQETCDLDTPGGGQYVLVTDGSILYDDIKLPRLSCLFRYPEEPPLHITASKFGATVLVLQFPVIVGK